MTKKVWGFVTAVTNYYYDKWHALFVCKSYHNETIYFFLSLAWQRNVNILHNLLYANFGGKLGDRYKWLSLYKQLFQESAQFVDYGLMWTIINAAFWLAELLLGCMFLPTCSGKRRLKKPKQWRLNGVLLAKVGLFQYLWPTSWILLKQLFLSPSWPLSQ